MFQIFFYPDADGQFVVETYLVMMFCIFPPKRLLDLWLFLLFFCHLNFGLVGRTFSHLADLKSLVGVSLRLFVFSLFQVVS